jgi:hypothetical protein
MDGRSIPRLRVAVTSSVVSCQILLTTATDDRRKATTLGSTTPRENNQSSVSLGEGDTFVSAHRGKVSLAEQLARIRESSQSHLRCMSGQRETAE